MCTFGEIVEPVSRSTWEDWDDEIPDIASLQWQQPLDTFNKIETLFILEGKFISECVKMHPQAHLKLINSVLEVNLHLYEMASNKYVCTIKNYNLLHSSEIVELLKPLIITSDNVVTIQTKTLLEYQTASPVNSPLIIRELSTSKPAPKLWDGKFKRLEQPNIISGVAAGVLCLREHLDLSATTLVYYIEHSEEYQTDEIQQILEKLKIINSICSTQVNGILNSNLYI
ncbi:uncharacterized protein LOC112043083 [Bicyclus anynana]|uniref:Proteasome assembly chaperone 1 n=1 Tax=Bicyclus anynana TaxID=110368 RepID=A0A6J1MUG8_BICAN|nr:uncharacterized protein LOC112043083 [Bicyclus anynana]